MGVFIHSEEGVRMSDRDDKYQDIVVNKFTEESARTFRDRVFKRSSLDPSLPIIVYIDSYGGSVDALNAMIASMHQVPNPIVTVCIGKAMSCGAFLLAAGDHRFCDAGSRILIHEVSGGSIESVNEMEADVDEVRRLNDQTMHFLAKRCNHTYEEMKKMMHAQDSRNIILNAKQALKFGIIDYIGTPIIKPLVLYTIETAPEHKYEKSQPELPDKAVANLNTNKPKKANKKTKKKKKVKK